uniref:Membrane transporter protein n=1 Tax=Caenorhabditis tropicalis TaxID=1561998 RepID=A0A1I7U9H4_9PELO
MSETTQTNSFLKWCKKYLLEGQQLDEKHVEKVRNFPENPTIADYLLIKYRKFVAVFIPFFFVQTIWWCTAFRYDFFRLYPDYWHMPVTMIFGALVAGMTAEGAGAVAFPVMTLVLHLDPTIARDFSLMGQSIVRPPVLCNPKKMLFVSIWTSFAFALGLLNAQKKRPTFQKIPEFSAWKAIILFLTGVIGGVFDAFAGSGIDICMFSIVTLLFRVSEKTATPTTMILKGVVSVFGFWYRGVMMGDISPTAWNYFAVTIPVVATMAPIGSFLGTHLHRQIIAGLIYALEIASLIGFLLTGPSEWLLLATVIIIVFGFGFFTLIAKSGEVLMRRMEEENKEKGVI